MLSEDERPMRLREACEKLGGGLTPSGLRRERDRGNLEMVRLAGKDFVTVAGIKAMIERCKVRIHVPAREASSPQVQSTSDEDVRAVRRAALRASFEPRVEDRPHRGRPRRDTVIED